ncbi:MAG TPA: creatininase family protein [Mycobacteriales bacterium]|jgi:creatinine amidohydrolase|nr:creatininase family protein [Mycobacteriales bacterium]
MVQRFIDLSGPESAQRLRADSVAVLPLGAVEHHGPHLPLSTDLTIADTFATALVEKVGVETDAWLLPPLAYTKSDEHAWASGTMWLSWDTVMRILVDLGNSLATSPVRRLVFLNAHGGNSALLQVASRELRRRFGLRTFVMHPGRPVDQGGKSTVDGDFGELGMGVHGGRGETSMMLHLRPDLVKMELAVRSVPDQLTRYEHVGFGKSVSFGWLSDDFGTGGVVGDPRGATAEQGKAAFEAALEHCAAAMREIARFDPSG